MSSRITCLLISACVFAASGVPADAQIGGFIKKKAKEAVPIPGAPPAQKPQSDDPAARALAQPDIMPITAESTARFRKALAVEARLRAEFRTVLASLKTPEQFNECKQQVAMSPEGQAIAMRLASLPDNATPAQLQQVMMKSGTELEALSTKRCGVDPAEQWSDAKRLARLQEIEGEASDALAAPGSAPPELGPTGPPAAGPWAPSSEGGQDKSHPYQRQYSLLKERWIPFCNALATAPEATGKGKYATVKGVGNGVYYYSSEEAAVMASNCVNVMSEIGETLGSVGRRKLP